jgi:hypothetical protein
MAVSVPNYATLCELGTFLGCAGFDEVYRLDGRCFAVTDHPHCRDLGRFYVAPWYGDPADLEDGSTEQKPRWNAAAA